MSALTPAARRVPRYTVHDEDGPLRSFWTKPEAERFMLPGMQLVVAPRFRKPKIDLSRFEPALF